MKDDVIRIKKNYYQNLLKTINELQTQNNMLKKIIDDGKISKTVEDIEECRTYFSQKAPIIFVNLSLYPLGIAERSALSNLIDDLNDFIEMGQAYFLNDEKPK